MTDAIDYPRIPSGYRLESVWGDKSRVLAEQIVSFWLEHKALPSRGHALARLSQAVYLVRDESSRIVALSTAYQKEHPRFGLTFFYFRCFVAPDHRRAGLARVLVVEVTRLLERRHAEGHDPHVVGVFVELQNQDVQRTMNQTVWPYVPMVYVGRGQGGVHERVYYFPGTRLR